MKTHLQHSDGIKNSGTRMEKRIKRQKEEQQPDQTSPRREGRGQEGPSSKKRLQAKRRQKEQGQEQGRATEQEKHEAIARAQVYGIDKDGPAWKGSALDENAHSRITKTSHGRKGLQTKLARPNRYRALGASSMGGESHLRARDEGAASLSRKRTSPDDYRSPTEALHQLAAIQTKDIKGADQGKGRARTARMTKQKKKNPEKSGLVYNIYQRGAGRKGLVRDLKKVAPKQRDSPKNQREKTGSIKGRAEPGRRCYQENRERLQSKSSQRTEAIRQRESNGKYSQDEFRDIRASDQQQRTIKRSEQRGPQGRVTTGDTGLKNEVRWIQGKAHRIVATPDKSPDLMKK